MEQVLISIMVLMSAPEVDDPLDPEVGRIWKETPEIAHHTAREWTLKYAMGQ